MPVTAAIKFVQGASVGTPGIALIGTAGTAVVCSNGNDTGVSTWLWTIVSVPSASSLTPGTGGTSPTFTFTPDVSGCFLIELQVVGTDTSTAIDKRAFGIFETNGLLIPSFQCDSGSLNFGGQLLGWDPYMEAWLQLVESLPLGGSPILYLEPGATPFGNVYADPTLASVALAAIGGPSTLAINLIHDIGTLTLAADMQYTSFVYSGFLTGLGSGVTLVADPVFYAFGGGGGSIHTNGHQIDLPVAVVNLAITSIASGGGVRTPSSGSQVLTLQGSASIAGVSANACLRWVGGSPTINLHDTSRLSAYATTIPSGTLTINLYDSSTLAANGAALTGSASGVINVYSAAATVDPSFVGLTGWTINYRFPLIQSGRTTLVNGVSPAIPANLVVGGANSSAIMLAYANPNASSAFGTLLAQDSDRTAGAPGSFIIRSFTAPGTPNTGDQSDVDWVVSPFV